MAADDMASIVELADLLCGDEARRPNEVGSDKEVSPPAIAFEQFGSACIRAYPPIIESQVEGQRPISWVGVRSPHSVGAACLGYSREMPGKLLFPKVVPCGAGSGAPAQVARAFHDHIVVSERNSLHLDRCLAFRLHFK